MAGRFYTDKQWARVEDKSDLKPGELPIWHGFKDRLLALRSQYWDLEAELDHYLMGVLKEYEAKRREIRALKAHHEAILEEVKTTLPNRAQGLSVVCEWHPTWDAPDYWLDNLAGLRLQVTPGPEHEWHDEWRQRLLDGHTSHGPCGPPPYPPFTRSAHYDTISARKEHPHPLYWEPDSSQRLAREAYDRETASGTQDGEPGHEEGTASESKPEEAGPSHTDGSALAPSPVTKESSTAPARRPSKRDKGKGKAVDPPTAPTRPTAASVAGTSSAPALPGSASAVTADAASPTSTTTSTITAAVANEETNQDDTADDADKSTIHVKTRPIKIKLVHPGSKRDLTKKGKAIDNPTSPKNNKNNKVTKPSNSDHPATVAKRETIKRSQVFKGNYWVFKLDSSMFTQRGALKKEFLTGKGKKGKATAKATAAVNVDDNDDDDEDRNDDDNGGEGSSKTTGTATTTSTNVSDDELALDANNDKGDNKKSETATTTASASSSSSTTTNKRKRTADDTGDDEFESGYYVLRCPLDGNCMTESNCTHNKPARDRGIFCRHPFKKRRAMDHIKACGLQGQIGSEKQIWMSYCKKGMFVLILTSLLFLFLAFLVWTVC